MIKPTIGRKVWYWPSGADKAGNFGMTQYDSSQPLDARIVAVWGDRMVNLLVVDHAGRAFPVTSVVLLQDGDEPAKDKNGSVIGRYAEWMPYQVGQAHQTALTEADAAADIAGTPRPDHPRVE